jgi:hypothetical protein
MAYFAQQQFRAAHVSLAGLIFQATYFVNGKMQRVSPVLGLGAKSAQRLES